MQKISGFLKLIRAGNLFIIGLSLSLFYYFIIVQVHSNILQTTLLPFSTSQFLMFVLSVLLLAAGGNVINDYFDFELDKEFKPERPLARSLMSLDTAMYLHMFLIFSGICLGFYLGWKEDNFQIGYLYITTALLLYIYSSFLKKIPLVGNVVIAGLSAFVFVLPLIFEASYLKMVHSDLLFRNAPYAFAVLIAQMKFYAGFALVTSLARELVKDIEDHEGDAAYNINTFAVRFGNSAAKWLSICVMVVLLAGLLYFMYEFFIAGAVKDIMYLGIAVLLPVVVTITLTAVAQQKKDYARVSFMLKLIMLLGLLSIPAFYLFHQTTT